MRELIWFFSPQRPGRGGCWPHHLAALAPAFAHARRFLFVVALVYAVRPSTDSANHGRLLIAASTRWLPARFLPDARHRWCSVRVAIRARMANGTYSIVNRVRASRALEALACSGGRCGRFIRSGEASSDDPNGKRHHPARCHGDLGARGRLIVETESRDTHERR